ncbi:MCL1 protein, partial [Centropus unirufus]|nr:MCL1 protein [Centropus unirufus]
MLAARWNAAIGFGFGFYFHGSGPEPPFAAASPGGTAAPPPPPAAAAAEVPGALIGSAGVCAAAGRREPPPSLIGCGAAPPSLIGCGAAPPSLIGCGAAPRTPEEELDGCEADPERGPAGESPPGPPDGLWQDTLELISRYLREAAGEAEPGFKKKLFPGLLGGPCWPGGGSGDAVMEKALETLRRVGNGVQQKHELAFQGMLRKLEILKEEDLDMVCEVAAHMFSDGITNWGRVVTLISFAAFAVKHQKILKQERCISSLARILTDAIISSKCQWLVSQGGWEGFVDFFQVEDFERSLRNILVAFAGVAGLGASLAYMIR